MQACDSEEDGLFGFDLHSDGDGQRHVIIMFLTKKSFTSFYEECDQTLTSLYADI